MKPAPKPFLDRHTRGYFNFGAKKDGSSNIDESNTQWPEDVTLFELQDALQTAFHLTQGRVTPNAVPVGRPVQFEIEIPQYGVFVKVGCKKYDDPNNRLVIDQFIPLRVSGRPATIRQLTPEKFDKKDMETLKEALGA